MHPTLVAQPFHHDGWFYEEKVDGWRMLAYKAAGTVKLVSRNGLDHTRRFPGIVAALRMLDASGLILDGEVAVYDAQLVSRFEWLRHSAPPDLSTPPLFMVFDCLQARGKDLRKEALYVRRNVIEDVLDEQDMVSRWSSTRCGPRRAARGASRACGGGTRPRRSAIPTG
jgi:bifunctional non-homologous end joining protein LigD